MATRDPDFPLVPHFTEPHIRVQASGTLGSGQSNETWTMGYKVICTSGAGSTVPEIATQQDVADCAAAGLSAFTNLIQTEVAVGQANSALVSSDVALTEVKAYAVGPDNHADVALQTVNVFTQPGTVVGLWAPAAAGDVSGRLPYSVALCITFRGALWRKGLAALGRFYVPGPNIFASNGATVRPLVDGLMDPQTVNEFAQAGLAFMTTVNQHASTGPLSHIMANVATTTKAQNLVRWQPITQIVVDSRPDTVRRRSNKIGGRGKVIVGG